VIEKAKLTANGASDFGRSVSINEKYAVVGATNINQSPPIGAAYFFSWAEALGGSRPSSLRAVAISDSSAVAVGG